MDSWVIGLIVVVVQTVVTTIIGTVVGLVIKQKWEKAKQQDAELKKLREEEAAAAESKRCLAVKETIHNEITDLNEKVQVRFDSMQGEMSLIKDGLQKDLYIDLVHIHDDLVNKQKYATREDKRDYENLYTTYHSLGKNGVADRLYQEVMALNESKPVQRKPRKRKVILNENK